MTTFSTTHESSITAEKQTFEPGKNYKWRICALLFMATTINYVDRHVFSILAPELQIAFQWDEITYGYIVTAFQLAYALGFLGMGNFMDRRGVRWGYPIAVLLWSTAAVSHSLARSAFGFGLARFGLGLGESGNFPAALKTVAEWFPEKERALATGIFNSGANIGAIIAPLLVPWIAIQWGWQWAFLATGMLGFLWIPFWLSVYKRPVFTETTTEKIKWSHLFHYKAAWAFILGKFLTDPVWWFYLYWLPKFLYQEHEITLDKIGPPLVIIYVVSDIGSIVGGWLSSTMIKKGWSVNTARKFTMLLCVLSILPIYFASQTSDLWTAVAFISIATAAHQGWSANLFTIVTDVFSKSSVGSVIGLGGTAGALGGMLLAFSAGYLITWTHSYDILFMIAASAYAVALLLIHLLLPVIRPINVSKL